MESLALEMEMSCCGWGNNNVWCLVALSYEEYDDKRWYSLFVIIIIIIIIILLIPHHLFDSSSRL